MNFPFILIVPGYPAVVNFDQIGETRFLTTLPNPASISEICFSVSTGLNIPECGIALYYSFNNNEMWNILGTVTTQAPSGIFRTGWGMMGVENCPFVNIGISLESEGFVNNLRDVIQSPLRREVPVEKVATDLYNFISSFATPSGGKIIIPSNIIDQWLDKTRKKLQMNPNYFYFFLCI